MKNIFTVLLFIATLVCLPNITLAELAAPTLSYSTNGLNISTSWTPVPEATGYTLYFAPYPFTGPETIGSIDMGIETVLSTELWAGATYYIAVKAYNLVEASEYSNIELFLLKAPEQGTETMTAATGGDIVLSGGTVFEVPEGAVDEDTSISVTTTPLKDSSGEESLHVLLEPEGVEFNTPATLTIPKPSHQANQGFEAYLYSTIPEGVSEDGEVVATTELDIVESSDFFVLEVPHFSSVGARGIIPLHLIFSIPTEYLEKGDIMYHMSEYKDSTGWLPGHVGLYRGPQSDKKKTMVQSWGGKLVNITEDVTFDDYGVAENAIGICTPQSFLNPNTRCYGVINTNAENWRNKQDSSIYLGAKRYKSGLTISQATTITNFAQSKLRSLYNYVGNFGGEGFGAYSCVGLVEESYEEAGLGLTFDIANMVTPLEQFRSQHLNFVSELTSTNNSTDRSVELYGVLRIKRTGLDTHKKIPATIKSQIPSGFDFNVATGILSWFGPNDSNAPSSGTYEFDVETSGVYDDQYLTATRSLKITIDYEDPVVACKKFWGKDESAAYECFLPLAEQGNADAQLLLAWQIQIVYDSSRREDQMYWFKQAGDNGLPDGYYQLAFFYTGVYGVEKDLDKAEYWLNRAESIGMQDFFMSNARNTWFD